MQRVILKDSKGHVAGSWHVTRDTERHDASHRRSRRGGSGEEPAHGSNPDIMPDVPAPAKDNISISRYLNDLGIYTMSPSCECSALAVVPLSIIICVSVCRMRRVHWITSRCRAHCCSVRSSHKLQSHTSGNIALVAELLVPPIAAVPCVEAVVVVSAQLLISVIITMLRCQLHVLQPLSTRPVVHTLGPSHC